MSGQIDPLFESHPEVVERKRQQAEFMKQMFAPQRSGRPTGSNADEWHLFLSKYLDMPIRLTPTPTHASILSLKQGEPQMTNDWYDTLIAAKARSRLNGLGYAFAVQWPLGHCTVEDRKPSLRDGKMRVVECTSDGRENLA